MKKHLLLILALLFSVLGFSQGIEFEHGTWKEVLAKAQQTNKPVFVDVYTSWCGPCKMMNKDIFPLEEVGKVYNANFVCYQIDAEKGEGVEIAKQYEVKGYPTYLFIKADGTIFHRAIGGMEANSFIDESNKALTEMNDPRPINVWVKEYTEKKSDPAFLLGYMDKRSKLGMPNLSLFDEYLKLIPEEERTSATVMDLYKQMSEELSLKSVAYSNLKKNSAKFAQTLGSVDTLLFKNIINNIDEAAKSKDEQLLAMVISEYFQLPANMIHLTKDQIYMDYYQESGEKDKYLKCAINFCNNTLMKVSDDTIAQRDKVNSQNFEKSINTGDFAKLDSARIDQLRVLYSNQEKYKVIGYLNTIALKVFESVSDKNILQHALLWSKRSQELLPKNTLLLETNANLLYKLGRKKEAIAKEGEALRYADKKDVERYKAVEETLRKMKAGEETWKK